MSPSPSSTTVRFNVLGRYPIIMDAAELGAVFAPMFEGRRPKLVEQSYFEFMRSTSSMWDVLLEATCVEELLRLVSGVDYVVEMYGGLGVLSTIIQEVARPKRHVVMDLSQACCRHLQRQGRGWEVVCADSWEELPAYKGADLYCMDHNSVTWLNIPTRLKMAVKTVELAPYWLWVDSAVSKLHMNLQAYSRAAGEPVTSFQDYLRVLDKRLFGSLGRTITHVRWHRNAAVMLTQVKGAAAFQSVVQITTPALRT